MASPNPAPPQDTAQWARRWQRFSVAALKFFHAYAGWLVSITWKRFFVFALLLFIAVVIVHDLPPLTWRISESVEPTGPRVVVVPPLPPVAAAAKPAPEEKTIRIESPSGKDGKGGVEISIGKDGVHIRSNAPAPKAAKAGSAPVGPDDPPPDESADRIKEEINRAVAEAKREIEEALREARSDAEETRRDAEKARKDAEAVIADLTSGGGALSVKKRTRRIGIGDLMVQLTLLWIAASAAIKTTYKGRMQAEVKAAQATETAEAESLKRQVVEARMAAMQAQVEPHFLFNTLASIDHLIETDPARASQMQKNLIALLRASMPTMREANSAGSSGPRDLGREIGVIKPYLEILKVRMEERLVTEIAVPEGLMSAEFPAMMIQTLVENAIKHGLEPKAEGGQLRVAAEIVHGKLQVTVADTGLGFGRAATAGTGVGLANIRERLQLLYGHKAALTVAENQPSGTVVKVTVPYKTVAGTEES